MEKFISPRICCKISCLLILAFSVLLTGCAVTGGSLSSSAYKGDMAEGKSLLDKGLNVNEKGGCGWGWDPDVTALTCAAHGGHMEVTKVLLERGVDVNAGSNNWRPLMSAAYAGHTEIAKLLIEKSADVDYTMAKLQAWPLGKDGLKFLERLVKKQPLRQPETLAVKSSTKPYPPPTKSDIDEK